MKNFRKLLAFTLVLAITLCACLPLSIAEPEDKLLGKITITFDKTSYAAGTPITASYSIGGGSGTYKSMNYVCYSIDNGNSSWVADGELTATTGTITFTPKYGQEAYICIWVTDSENRNFRKESDHVALTGGTDPSPLKAKLTLDKTECAVGTTITASYEVTGGSGNIWIWYYCEGYDNGSWFTISEGSLDEAKGTFTFTPTKGQEANVYLNCGDEEDRSCYANASVTLTGGESGTTDSVSVEITFSKSTYPVGKEITANYKISGGSGSYPEIRYSCYSYDGEDSILVSEGKLAEASGTIKFTPKYGQEVGVNIYGTDSKGNDFNGYNWAMLTDSALKKPKITKVTALSKKKIKIEWTKLSKKQIKKAKYIQVFVSTDKAFNNIVAYKEVSPKKASVTIKGLTKNTKYYVRIRTVGQNDEGTWVISAWSSTKKVKTPKK